MNIRKTTLNDFEEVSAIYGIARAYMRSHGNPDQWGDAYPSGEMILEDIQRGNSYLIEEAGQICGVFVFIIGEDPSYRIIQNGKWNSSVPYGTIHRIASNGRKHGIAQRCFEYCDQQIDYLRIDTHRDNLTMQAAIKGFGFRECGTIFVSNGPRLAFDRIRPE